MSSNDHGPNRPDSPPPNNPKSAALVLVREQITPFGRGAGVTTRPYVGRWNSADNRLTSGITTFEVGTAIPLHTHNVEEHVLVFEGEAVAEIGEQHFQLESGSAIWIPAGVPHRVINGGQEPLTIFWVYGGRDVTRTICATGETFVVHSERDREIAAPADDDEGPGESAPS